MSGLLDEVRTLVADARRTMGDGAAGAALAQIAARLDEPLRVAFAGRVKAGKRRSPPTAEVKGRYVPVEVRRELHQRQGGRCAVPYCDFEMFVEMAHVVAHASGGDREAENLLLLCSDHHGLLDEGRMLLTGTAKAPRFFDDAGRDLALRGLGDRGGGRNGARIAKETKAKATHDPP